MSQDIATKEKAKEAKIELSDGRKASIRDALGRDVIAAQNAAPGQPGKLNAMLIVQCTTIDGKRIKLSDVEGLKARDYLNLVVAVQGGEEDDDDLGN